MRGYQNVAIVLHLLASLPRYSGESKTTRPLPAQLLVSTVKIRDKPVIILLSHIADCINTFFRLIDGAAIIEI